MDDRVSAEKMASVLSEAMRLLPPLGYDDIEDIIANPSMNFFQKIAMIRRIKKHIEK